MRKAQTPTPAGNTRISPAERAARFAQTTRQNIQVLPAVPIAENQTISFTLPKTRLLSKLRAIITGTVTLTHAAISPMPEARFAPYNFIRNVRVEANNGFTFVNLSGVQLYLWNLLHNHSVSFDPVVDALAATALTRRGKTFMGAQTGAGGQANVLRIGLDIPITLNDRDPQGLILLQNEETVVTVTIELNDADVLAAAIAGYTVAFTGGQVTPVVETFAIPAVADALPDLSLLKLVAAQQQTIAGAGVVEIRLPVGLTYRKLLLDITTAAGAGFTDAQVNGNIELIFNQADVPYRMPPAAVASINAEQYGRVLPAGVYAIDFASFQGLANYAGGRDLVDTERLTEFWVRFPAAVAGNVNVIYEAISRLR